MAVKVFSFGGAHHGERNSFWPKYSIHFILSRCLVF